MSQVLDDEVLREAGDASHPALHHRERLRRARDEDAAVVGGRGERRVPLEVEVLLAAAPA